MARHLSRLHPALGCAALIGLAGFSLPAIAQTPENPITGVTITVKEGCANIRKTPSPVGEIVDCLEGGTVLKPVIGQQGDWLLLSSGNWVWKDVTSFEATTPITGVTVTVKEGCANIRKTPSTTGEIVDCVENGTVLRPVINQQGDWLQLSSGNWVWKNVTSLGSSSDGTTGNPEVANVQRILKYVPGNLMRGDDVTRLQRKLNEHRVLAAPIGVDGVFGEGTKKAVEALQQRHNLPVDGIAGPQVFSLLNL